MPDLYPPQRPNVLSVVFATDDNYVKYLTVALHSLLVHLNRSWLCDIIILSNLSSEKQKELLDFAGHYGNCLLRFLLPPNMDAVFVNGQKITFKLPTHVTLAGYYRLFLADLLPRYNKILYMDVDTFVLGDLAPLAQLKLNDHYLAAVPDVDIPKILNYPQYATEVLRVPATHCYFNSGVLLMNLKLWREQNLLPKSLLIAQNMTQRRFNDQDVLNALSAGHVGYLPVCWNYQLRFMRPIPSIYPPKERPRILHFLGREKPWVFTKGPISEAWWRVYQQLHPHT